MAKPFKAISLAELALEGQKASSAQMLKFDLERRNCDQQKLEALINRAGIPKRYVNKSFDDFCADTEGKQFARDMCQRYADQFEDVLAWGRCMILTGTSGTGKTHLSCAILKRVVEAGYTGLFLTQAEMLRTIRATYSPASKLTEVEVFNRYLSADLLILDEIGVSIGSELTREALIFEVINGRSQAMKPTVILGNLNPKQMEEYLGDRIWDRIQEHRGPLITFDWESYRRV